MMKKLIPCSFCLVFKNWQNTLINGILLATFWWKKYLYKPFLSEVIFFVKKNSIINVWQSPKYAYEGSIKKQPPEVFYKKGVL